MEKYDEVTPFLDAELVTCSHHAHVFVSMKKVLHLPTLVCEAIRVKEKFQSAMFDGDGIVKKLRKYEEKISYQNIRDV